MRIRGVLSHVEWYLHHHARLDIIHVKLFFYITVHPFDTIRNIAQSMSVLSERETTEHSGKVGLQRCMYIPAPYFTLTQISLSYF